jgi:hypothetical protein
VREVARLLSQPKAFSHTKILKQKDLIIAFPNALGLPSVFTLATPALMKIGGEVRLHSQPDLARGSNDAVRVPESMNVTADIQIV